MKTLREYIEQVEESYDDPAIGDYFDLEIARDETLLETYVVDIVEDGIVIEADDTMMRILTHAGYLNENSNMPPAQDSTSPINGKKDAVSRRKKDARAFNFETSADTDLCEESLTSDSPVANAIVRRIMSQHPGVLTTHGPERVMQAAQEVADWVGEVDEIGSSDVSGWTRDAIRALAELPDEPMDVVDKLGEAEYRGRTVPLGKPMRGDVAKSKVYVRDPKTGNVKKVNFGDPNMKIKKSNPARRKSFRARHNCDNPGPRTKARYWSCRAW